jgi:hypothetical protein
VTTSEQDRAVPPTPPADEELIEDLEPEEGLAAPVVEELEDKTAPLQGIATVRTTQVPRTHDQVTRRTLALIILIALGLSYLAIIAFFLLGFIDSNELTAAIAASSGIQALAAAAVGFYYGSRHG